MDNKITDIAEFKRAIIRFGILLKEYDDDLDILKNKIANIPDIPDTVSEYTTMRNKYNEIKDSYKQLRLEDLTGITF